MNLGHLNSQNRSTRTAKVLAGCEIAALYSAEFMARSYLKALCAIAFNAATLITRSNRMEALHENVGQYLRKLV